MAKRATIVDIHRKINGILTKKTLRNWVDQGILPAERDFRGWRWFPNPEETVQQVKDLLYGKEKPPSENDG